MSPAASAASSAAGSAPLPPLPDLQGSGGGDPQAGGFMAAMMASVSPVKAAADQIMSACQKIVQSGAVPGSEQICAQIIGLANQLVPMAVQQAAQPGQGAGAPPSPGGIAPPPSGGAPLIPSMGAGQ